MRRGGPQGAGLPVKLSPAVDEGSPTVGEPVFPKGCVQGAGLPVNLSPAVDEGSPTVGEPVFPKGCVQCGAGEEKAGENKMLRCTQCKVSCYCSKSCQKEHWAAHKVICGSIAELEEQDRKKCKQACEFADSSLGSAGKQKLLQLIGDRCIVKCNLNGIECNSLWDTGAQISLISKSWLEERNVKSEVRDLSELIGRDLKVKGAAGADIPYCGYTVLDCTITGVTTSVPFLVSEKEMDQPIIGYNVISYLASNFPDKVTVSCVKETFPKLTTKTAEAVLNILQTKDLEKVSSVKLHKFNSVIRKGASISVPCRIANVKLERQLPVLFEPESEELLPRGLELSSQLLTLKRGHNRRLCITITNVSGNDITLPGRTRLGELFLVTSVTPAEVTHRDAESRMSGQKAEDDQVVPPTGDGKFRFHMNDAGAEEDQTTEDQTSPTEPRICEVSASVNPADASLDIKYREQLAKIHLPTELSEAQKTQVREMLWRERRAFAEDQGTIGSAEDLQMGISTEDEVPVQKRYNSIPQPLLTQVKGHVEDMLNRGWITRSSSAWSSPVVIVRKQGGEIRLCCDFRQLNSKTIADKHPLPRVQESLDSLNGSEWFSVVDLTRAYYQGYIAPESRHKTAFVTPWGFYQWVRIPFGLMNAPANFQRYMENVVGDLRGKCALPYLDDIIIHSKSFSDHVDHIAKVLQRLQEHGLKLKAEKCDMFQQEVKFLGRIVNKDGYRMDGKNIQAVEALKDIKPKDVSEVRQLLGLLGYHRRHIQDFSRLAKPITDLLLKSNNSENDKNPKKARVEWTDTCQKAATKLIEMITSSPFLAYADFEREFILHTDASMKGLGAILYQKDDEGRMRVIGYGSRTLRKAEMNYHPTKLEFLALKWAVTEEFHEYLGYANGFQAYTDNNPLTYLMQATKLNAFAERWVSELAEYKFKINYRPGVVNKDADCLSRLPLDITKYTGLCTESVEPNVFEAVMAGLKVQGDETEAWRICLHNAHDVLINMVSLESDGERVNIRKAQEDDDILSQIMILVNAGVKPRREPGEPKELRRLKLELDKLCLKEGVLMRKQNTLEQIVLPKSLRQHIYDELHAGMGHLGADRVGELARRRVYWPGMQQDIENYIQHQCPCLAQRRPARKKNAALQSINTNGPLELVTMDYLHLEKGSGGYEYILVIVDHFTKFTQAYPTRNKSSKTAARHLYDDFLLRFGIPAKFLSDQGKEFDCKVIHELCQLTGVKKIRTTPYHPQTNGITERMNRTILHMLRTLPESAKSKWPSMLNKLVHAYNCTRHSVTGFTPFRLMFGREATLPIDLLLGITSNDKLHTSHTEFAQRFESEMKQAWEIVKRNQKANQDQNVKRALTKPLLSPVGVGDRVLIRNTETGGPGKLRSYWEQDVYRVLAEKGDLGVVLEVRKENDSKARRRVVHRNMLFPVNDQFECAPDQGGPVVPIPHQRVRGPVTRARTAGRPSDERGSEDTQTDTDEELGFTPQQLAHRRVGTEDDDEGGVVRDLADADEDPIDERGDDDQVVPPTGDDQTDASEVGEQTFNELFPESDQDNTFTGFQPSSPPHSSTRQEYQSNQAEENASYDDTAESLEADVEEAEDVDSENTASGGYEAEEDVDSDDTAGGEQLNENTDGEGEQGSSREASNEVEAEADVVGDHDIVDIPEEDMIAETPDMEMYLQESVEADESDSQGLEMVDKEPDTVERAVNIPKQPKSVRDLLDFNNPGLMEDAAIRERVESVCSPQTRAKVRRTDRRLQDLERMQSSREEALDRKRSSARKLDVSEVAYDEEDDWRSWLAQP